MGSAIRLRLEPLNSSEQTQLWQSLCDDESLNGIAYKIETDAWGGIKMSPTQAKHSRMVRRVARLIEEKLGGEALTELAITSEEGVKVPDVAWCSAVFLEQHWSEFAQTRAPEICVEVVSPSNSAAELKQKTDLYLRLGAVEVWIVSDDAAVEIHTQSGMRDDSTFGFNPAKLLAL